MRTLLSIIFLLSMLMSSAQTTMYVTIGNQTLTATLADNDAAKQLCEQLKSGPVSIDMRDYGGFEKVGDLPWSLPASDRPITTDPGDIMLYLGYQIVFFYGSNKWDYTPLGKFDNVTASALKAFLSGSTVRVTLSLSPTTGVDAVLSDSSDVTTVFDVYGRKVNMDGLDLCDLPHGIYIINGKKCRL